MSILLFGAIEFWVYRNKKEIFRKIQEIANDKLNGEVNVGDITFRPFNGGLGLNFTLSDITLTDSLYAKYKTPLLQSEFIHVSLNFNSIFSGTIKVKNLVFQNGNIKIFKDGG